jgi:hypothetical protein
MHLIHLRNKSIDYNRWDECIAKSHNHLAYAYTWFLDIVSPGWEALISENYKYIMPLPTKSKYKIPYLVQPVLTQQLGIFSEFEITREVVEEFIKEIPYYSYELNLNECNFSVKARVYPNYMLSLNKTYNEISAGYSKNNIRNIEKAHKNNLTVKFNIDSDEFLNLYFSTEKKYKSVNRAIVEKLIEKGISENAIYITGVYSNDNELIAGVCLLQTFTRITYLLPVSNAIGKSSSAMFLLIDKLIQKESGKLLSLDFEGSRIEGIARFYSGFGATNHPYYILKRMRPSFLINKF